MSETAALLAAIRDDDEAAVRAALANGENPRILTNGETALHTAVRQASAAIVAALIEGGALEWVPDSKGRTPLDLARASARENRDALVALLDCSTIDDASFREAVAAIHAGDRTKLAALLDAQPRLLHDRALDPEPYRKRRRPGYFRDPKLFWFVANNPTRVERMPANIAEIAQTMIDRGVEQSDLEYALELVMSSGTLTQRQVHGLMRVLLDAGARPTKNAIAAAAAHGVLEPLHALVERGYEIDAPLAAAFGDARNVRALLAKNPAVANLAFGFAVINRHVDAARAALDAGAEIDAFIPVHSHGTALHQAAANDDVPMIELLLERGARTDICDTLWDGTPLGWATFAGHAAAKAALAGKTAP